jgi:hypothetical protein
MPNPIEIEISEMRKRVRASIEKSRRAAAARRARLEEAAADYARFLDELAVPLVRMLASALRAEGYPFTVFTPSGGLRLASAKAGEDFVEFALDTSQPDPTVVLRVNRARGRRILQHERPVREHTPADRLTEDDVLHALLDELAPFLEK